jgi:hypothetical protein
MHSPRKRDRVFRMTRDLPSTGETQMIPIEERQHGFVDNCIKLIEDLLDGRDLPVLEPQPEKSADRS